jgi:2,4-dienoyl-CoA reductase-like NADH-dependent reductase (Old Yellow Enzyme family)
VSSLFDPYTVKSLEIPNRVWMSPMCMYSAESRVPETGCPTDWHLAHLASRAAGGAGLIMVEATGVRSDGRITPWDLGLWNADQEKAFSRIARVIRELGSVPAIQLAHAGRKASSDRPWLTGGQLSTDDGGWPVKGPSAMAYGHWRAPEELSREELLALVEDFAAAARRARNAGFQVVEIHGAHGYLIGSFLSPHTNGRTDEYGGSFENRSRFALEVVDAVRAVWPAELPVFFRLSATDWLSENPGDPREGWSVADSVRLATILRAHGVDLLDVSSGGLVPDARITAGPGYQVPFAETIRVQAGIPTAAVGLINEPQQAQDILHEGKADAVFLGREMLRNPYWARHAAATLGHVTDWPTQYGYAVKTRHRVFQRTAE